MVCKMFSQDPWEVALGDIPKIKIEALMKDLLLKVIEVLNENSV